MSAEEYLVKKNICPDGQMPAREIIESEFWRWVREFHQEYNDDWFARNMPRLKTEFMPIWKKAIRNKCGGQEVAGSNKSSPVDNAGGSKTFSSQVDLLGSGGGVDDLLGINTNSNNNNAGSISQTNNSSNPQNNSNSGNNAIDDLLGLGGGNNNTVNAASSTNNNNGTIDFFAQQPVAPSVSTNSGTNNNTGNMMDDLLNLGGSTSQSNNNSSKPAPPPPPPPAPHTNVTQQASEKKGDIDDLTNLLMGANLNAGMKTSNNPSVPNPSANANNDSLGDLLGMNNNNNSVTANSKPANSNSSDPFSGLF